MKLFSYLFVFVLLLLSACSSQSPTISVTPPPISTLSSNNTQPQSDYPTASFPEKDYPSSVETEPPTPTTDPSLGVVKGKLFLNGKPVPKAVLFLADVIKDDKGNDSLVSVDYNTPNRAHTEDDGSFKFVNILSKRYALVLVVVPNSFLLMTPGTQDGITVDVVNGKTIDLGLLNYDALPIP